MPFFKKNKNFQSGFTLMETLLAVTLFAIVITSSYGVFSMGIQIWKRTVNDSRYDRKLYFVFEKMQTDIQSTLPVPRVDDLILKEDKDMTFGGDEKAFLLPAIIPIEDKKGGITYQSGGMGYAWDSHRKVLCRQTLTASDFFLRRKPVCKDSLQNVRHADFEYLAGNPLNESYSWYRGWNGKEGIPRAVRMVLQVDPKDKRKTEPQVFRKTFWIPVSDRISEELTAEAPVTEETAA